MYPRGATLDVVAPAAAVLATGRLLHPPQCPVCAPQNRCMECQHHQLTVKSADCVLFFALPLLAKASTCATP